MQGTLHSQYPEEAAEFVAKTGVDSLAIAIGTSHGAYKFKGEPYLDFERLKRDPQSLYLIHLSFFTAHRQYFLNSCRKCNEYGGDIPGAQGVPEDMIRTATKDGICKVNIDTDLRLAMTAEIRKHFSRASC